MTLLGSLFLAVVGIPKSCVDSDLFNGDTIRHTNPRDVIVSGDEFRAFLVGDFGVDTKEVLGKQFLDHFDVEKRNDLANRMKERTSDPTIRKPDFVLNVGDSFYPQGVRDISSSRFNTTFESVFTQPDTYWYTTLGNHEWYGNKGDNKGTRTMLHYTEQNSHNRWCLPDYNYTLSVKVNSDFQGESFNAKIVFLDTYSIIHQNPTDSTDPTAYGDVTASEQLKWAEEQLCNSINHDWLIVVTHYPMITSGPRIRKSKKKWNSKFINSLNVTDDVRKLLLNEFSYDQNQDFRNDVTEKYLLSILTKCGVDAYISGHEHMTQIMTHDDKLLMMSYGDMGNGNMKKLLTEDPSKTACQLTGLCIASEKTIQEVWGGSWKSVFQHYDGAFGDVRISKSKMILKTIDTRGVIVNAYTHTKSITNYGLSTLSDDGMSSLTIFVIGLVLLLFQQIIFCVIYKKHISPVHNKTSTAPYVMERSVNGETEAEV